MFTTELNRAQLNRARTIRAIILANRGDSQPRRQAPFSRRVARRHRLEEWHVIAANVIMRTRQDAAEIARGSR